MNPEVTNDRGRHPFLDLPLAYMDTSELHRASGGSTDKNLPTLLQVNTRAPKGTTSAFPIFPGERIQAVAAGTLHPGFPQGTHCTAGSIQSCSWVFPCSSFQIPCFVKNCLEQPFIEPVRQQRHQFSTLVLVHIPWKTVGNLICVTYFCLNLKNLWITFHTSTTRNAASLLRYSFRRPWCKVWCWGSHSLTRNNTCSNTAFSNSSVFVLSFPEIFPSNCLSVSLT